MTGRFINGNAFGAATAESIASASILEVLRDAEFFRYRDDGRKGWTDRLEHDFAAWYGLREAPASAVTTTSGTAALTVALRTLGIGQGDHVLVPAFTFIATPMAVVNIGAIPEPLDSGPDLSIDICDMESRLHPGVKAVIAVHVQGHAAEVESAAEVLDARGIPLIEDACQGFGASCQGVQAGAVGTMSCFSFQQAKQLASGEGGMILARHPAHAAICRKLVDLGAVRDAQGRPSWDHPEAVFGQNLRMTELQAALLVPQLANADAALTHQRKRRAELRRLVEDLGVHTFRSRDPEGDTGSHLLLETADRTAADAMIQAASDRSVLVRRVWDKPYYQYKLFESAGMAPGPGGPRPAEVAEGLASRLVSVPLPPTMPDAHLDIVAEAIAAGAPGRQGTVPR